MAFLFARLKYSLGNDPIWTVEVQAHDLPHLLGRFLSLPRSDEMTATVVLCTMPPQSLAPLYKA